MIMETLSCGYPVAPSGLGAAPISPPASPPPVSETYDLRHHRDCGSPQGLYAPTSYAQPAYADTQLHPSPFRSKFDEDANNNNHIYGNGDAFINNNNNEDSLLCDLSSLSISESEDRFSELLSPVSEASPCDFSSMIAPTPPSSRSKSYSSSASSSASSSKKSSRSKAKSSTESLEGEKSRKDSFVYDVRLTNEQFLFFVPDLDLVKSHLMFAVREEVDVLKDRIVELMDRIKHLECENTILRQYASPEVLQQIQSQMPHQQQQPQ